MSAEFSIFNFEFSISKENSTFTVRSLSVRFITLAIRVAVSPSRRKRGILGCIMSSFRVMSCRSSEPVANSCVHANPFTFHCVSRSGAVKL